MPAPTSASRHYRRIQRLAAITIAAARQSWRKMDPARNWEQQYQEEGGIGTELALLAGAAQVAAARESDSYVADVLNELAFGPPTRPGVLNIPGYVGAMGDGRPVATLLEHTVVKAGRSFNEAYAEAGGPMTAQIPGVFDREKAATEALEEAEKFLDLIMHEVVAETARAAESAAMVQREWVEGYVRMLNPPSCSRCVVLAGRFYLWNEGFDRHPGCDCVHIPWSEKDDNDPRVNPELYFDSLSEEEQDKVFTKAGARAVRDGADLNQVVNARRGMSTAAHNARGWIPKGRLTRNDFGVFTTTEGTTRLGLANRSRTGRNATFRLMPESIYEIAGDDRTEAIRLLKLAGFILP